MNDLITITRAQLEQAKGEAWDEGYTSGNLDGYFGTRDEKNPYRSADEED